MLIDHHTINALRTLAYQCADDGYTSAGVEPATLLELLDAFEERDALAAHEERLKALHGDMFWGTAAHYNATESAFNDTPETSLARRDLINQAEGAERVRDRLREKANNARSQARQQDSAFYHRCANVAANKASDLRQQAEGHQ